MRTNAKTFLGKRLGLSVLQSFAGNLATASPIGDLNPIWMAANASVVLVSASGEERTVSVDENFFIEYRKTIIRDDEIIKGIWIPFTERVSIPVCPSVP